MRRALVIGHVAFEDLGTLAPALTEAGFAIRTLQAGVNLLPADEAMAAELLVVLGGPIGVYDEAAYPFLATEKTLIGERLRRRGVTLGICLGAQLMAAALGARVYPGSAGKEIGWSPLLPTVAGDACSELAPLFAPGVSVLHWHGDTFDLPTSATHLAASKRYAQQVFVYGDHGWGFQCHPEVRGRDLECWFIGHACELAQAGIDVNTLRAETQARAENLEQAAGRMWRDWLCARFD